MKLLIYNWWCGDSLLQLGCPQVLQKGNYMLQEKSSCALKASLTYVSSVLLVHGCESVVFCLTTYAIACVFSMSWLLTVETLLVYFVYEPTDLCYCVMLCLSRILLFTWWTPERSSLIAKVKNSAQGKTPVISEGAEYSNTTCLSRPFAMADMPCLSFILVKLAPKWAIPTAIHQVLRSWNFLTLHWSMSLRVRVKIV